jgi:hypothetical protein
LLKPLILRTNCNAAAVVSSRVASLSGCLRTLILRHIDLSFAYLTFEKVNLALLLLISLAAHAAEVGYIVTMYSAKDTPGLGGFFTVTVDGRKVAKLRYPTYYRLPVPPGAYTITMDAPTATPILCNLIAGETCYVRARKVGKENRREAALISPEEAYRELRKTFLLDNEHIYMREWKK